MIIILVKLGKNLTHVGNRRVHVQHKRSREISQLEDRRIIRRLFKADNRGVAVNTSSPRQILLDEKTQGKNNVSELEDKAAISGEAEKIWQLLHVSGARPVLDRGCLGLVDQKVVMRSNLHLSVSK